MKTIEAVWDKISLGVNTYEIEIESATNTVIAENIVDIRRNGGQYLVVKIPAHRNDLMSSIPDLGFYFAECQLEIVLKRKNYEMHCLPLSRLFSKIEHIDISSK